LLLFLRPGISPALWKLFPMMYYAWQSFAYDLITNIAAPIDNYISRGTEMFLAGVEADGTRYVEMVLDMCSGVLGDDRQSEVEAKSAAQLLMVLLHHCIGGLDNYISSILSVLKNRLSKV
ncbi:unnamed protein product, partial [Discosporangium mesarthrocarpum]